MQLLKNMINYLCFFMLIKYYYHLHLLVEFERGVVDQSEIIVSTSELAMELVNKKLLIFRCYQVNVKDTSVHCNGGRNTRTCFL